MKKIIAFFICLSFLFSCKKDVKTNEPTNNENNSSVIKGTISGSIKQYNQSGELLTTGLEEVTVSLDNDKVTAKSDASGKYSLQGVKPGVYTIFFSKPGCETYQVQQVNFPGNGTLFVDGTVIESPSINFESVSMSMDTVAIYNSVKVTVKLTPQNKDTWVAFISGTDNALDLNKTNFYGPFGFKIPANTSTYTFKTNSSSNNYGRVYAFSGVQSSYYDFATKTSKYQGFGSSSEVIKFR